MATRRTGEIQGRSLLPPECRTDFHVGPQGAEKDIPLLVEYFLKKFNAENSKNVSLSGEALRILTDYNRPDNGNMWIS